MRRGPIIVTLILLQSLRPLPLPAQRVHIGPVAGYMAYGTYFEGPGDVRFSNRDGLSLGLAADWSFHPLLGLAAQASYATSDWIFHQVPSVGDVNVGGAHLWFVDASLRFRPLGARTSTSTSEGVQPFVQVGGGITRYAIKNILFDEHATNVALTLGGGLALPLGRRLRAEALVKDWISSFKSVEQAGQVGATGQRAHTLAILAGVSVGF